MHLNGILRLILWLAAAGAVVIVGAKVLGATTKRASSALH